MGGRPLWQAEIGRIIARTEENLRAPRTGPPLYKVPRVAEAAFTAPLLHASFMTSTASAEERRTPAPAATVPIEPSPPPSASVIAALTSGLSGEARTVATRLLEHTRADIDLRSNLAGRHAQALREELAHGLHEAERRWVDLAKEIEATVSGAIEAERQLRAGGEEKTTRLEASVAATRKELLGLIGDGQAELVEQGGVLRQVEQELLAFKAETEVALAEEGKRLSALAERQRVAAGELDTAAAGETIGRLQELETALLKERELRKAVEAELGELRCSVAQERDRLPAEIEAAVAREVALSGGGAAAVAALEDKVKECGRLLLRMGGDLMEEGRRRQAIEAPDPAVHPAARLATPGTRPRPVHDPLRVGGGAGAAAAPLVGGGGVAPRRPLAAQHGRSPPPRPFRHVASRALRIPARAVAARGVRGAGAAVGAPAARGVGGGGAQRRRQPGCVGASVAPCRGGCDVVCSDLLCRRLCSRPVRSAGPGRARGALRLRLVRAAGREGHRAAPHARLLSLRREPLLVRAAALRRAVGRRSVAHDARAAGRARAADSRQAWRAGRGLSRHSERGPVKSANS